MGYAVKGSPGDAVKILLLQGEETRNAKLIELAGLVAQRHHEKIADVAALQARARELVLRYCSQGAHVIGTKPGGRSAGGPTIRT